VLTVGLLLALGTGVLFFHGLGRYPLLDPDEARHAEVAREMAAGDGLTRFLLPTLDFRPYREKPAPFYWPVALAYALAGIGEAAARAVSASAAWVTVLALYAYAVPRVGIGGAVGAALVGATTVGWFGLARYVNLDMALTACVTLGVLAGLAWLDRPAPRSPPVVPYIAAGIGTLVKGPIAVVLTAGPLVFAAALQRSRPALAELGLLRGAALTAGIAALFYGPVALLDPSYTGAFAETNLRRFAEDSPHAAGPLYYFVWLPVLALPWTLLAVPALVRAARDPTRRPLVLWLALVPAVLTLASGKLATYAVSALAPFALIVGPDLARTTRWGPAPDDDVSLRIAGMAGVGLLFAAVVAPFVAARWYPVPLGGQVALALAALAWTIALGSALVRDRLGLVPLAVLGATLTLYPLAVRWVAPAVAALHSTRDAARLAAGAPVVAFGIRDPSMTFYLRGPVLHTDDPDLLRAVFSRDEPVFVLTSRRHFTTVEKALDGHMHRWFETRRRRLYGNRPRPASTPLQREGPNGSS
jgi:4-amino-4-deoxy-L-arabinose transferase-like glycosyltransferase